MDRTDAFLQHYASQPYDPVKAHEYYIKNRQLKNRTTSGMSQLQKEAWIYSKDNISNDKKQQLESKKELADRQIEAFQKNAAETRTRISEKLKLLSEKLVQKAEKEREQIADKLKQDIANVAPIPEGVSKERRAILVERRNKEIADIRNTSSKHAANLSSDNKDARQDGSNDISKERAKTATDLKAIINTTRDTYKKEKAKLIADYETKYQQEYSKVLATVTGKAKGKSKANPEAGNNKGIIYYNGKGSTR